MFSKITRKNLENFLAPYASPKKVLDLGSGGSSYDRFFPNRLTVDIDPERGPEIVADIHKLPFKDEEFEIILCTEVLEHLVRPSVAIAEIHRVLKKKGMLLLTTRFVYPIHDAPGDYWRFTIFGMRELFKNWDIVELKPETQTFSALGALMQRVVFQTSLRFNKVAKIILLFLAWIFDHLNFLLVQENGDIKKTTKVDNIMSTGYYLVAKKKD